MSQQILTSPVKKSSPGFSLVEILVVITIIAILTTVGLVSYSQITKNARDAKRKADLEMIRSALVQYSVDVGDGRYPWTIDFSTMSPLQNYTSVSSVSDPQPSPYKQYTYYYDSVTNEFWVCAELEGLPASDEPWRNYCVREP